jgi:hypothetical protein
LERLVEGSYELPAFRTLNDMATTIRVSANRKSSRSCWPGSAMTGSRGWNACSW